MSAFTPSRSTPYGTPPGRPADLPRGESASPAETVRWMLAMQAQDFGGVKWSCSTSAWTRSPSSSRGFEKGRLPSGVTRTLRSESGAGRDSPRCGFGPPRQRRECRPPPSATCPSGRSRGGPSRTIGMPCPCQLVHRDDCTIPGRTREEFARHVAHAVDQPPWRASRIPGYSTSQRSMGSSASESTYAQSRTPGTGS